MQGDETEQERRLADEGRASRKAEEISHRMVDVVRVEDNALLLDAKYEWAEAICAVLEMKGVRVNEFRKQTMAERLIA